MHGMHVPVNGQCLVARPSTLLLPFRSSFSFSPSPSLCASTCHFSASSVTSSAASSAAPKSSRRQVTVYNDDGRVRWKELSVREKAARTTQQSVNVLVVLAGMAATVNCPATTATEWAYREWAMLTAQSVGRRLHAPVPRRLLGR